MQTPRLLVFTRKSLRNNVVGLRPTPRWGRWPQTPFLALLVCAGLAALVASPSFGIPSAPVRIKDIATVAGTGGQKVMGYGLVVGLEGTGDSTKSALTAQALANMLEHFDLKCAPADLCTKNVAAVIATANLPSVVREGDKIDVSVASVGDATSIYGGMLLPTPLRANDNECYAIAQGSVSIGGMNASSGGQKIQKNHPLAGRVVEGGAVIKSIAPDLTLDQIHFTLLQPDFTTALRIAEAINKELGCSAAKALAPESVQVDVPAAQRSDLVGFVSTIESLSVVSDAAARVVVNERTGTVIIGGDVRILPVAVAQGSLTITVSQNMEVSQPEAFSGGVNVYAPTLEIAPEAAPAAAPAAAAPPPPAPAPAGGAPAVGGKPGGPGKGAASPPAGKAPPAARPPAGGAAAAAAALPGARTVVTPHTSMKAEEANASLVEIHPQTRLSDLVEALNSLGVKPRDLIAILQALKAANALQAELVLM